MNKTSQAAFQRHFDRAIALPDEELAAELRLIYLHMIEEYAQRVGHADLLRELIDGATGE